MRRSALLIAFILAAGCQVFTDLDGYTWYSDTGSDTSSELGTTSDNVDLTGTGNSSDSDTDTGSDSDTGPASETDTDSQVDSETQTASEGATDSYSSVDTQTTNDTETVSDNDQDSASVSDTGNDTSTGTDSQTDTETASEQHGSDSTDAPFIISVVPDDGETGISLYTEIIITFSESVVVPDGSIVLSSDDSQIAGTLIESGDHKVTFSPDAPLSLARKYTVSIAGEIVDPDGNSLQNRDDTWSFWTTEGVWSDAMPVENASVSATKPQVAMSTTGIAIAVWQQDDGTNSSIWANRFTADGGWEFATRIDNNTENSAQNPRIAVDDDGNAMAVWDESNGSMNNIWACRFDRDDGWEMPVLLEENDSGGATNPQIQMDSTGSAMAVWGQSPGSYTQRVIWGSRFEPGFGWAKATVAGGASYASAEHATIDPNGNVIVVWTQKGSLWTNWFVPGTGWGVETVLDPDPINPAYSPRISGDALGNAVAVWQQKENEVESIWACKFIASEGWFEPFTVDNSDISMTSNPMIDLAPDGNAIVVWQLHTDYGHQLWANHFSVEEETLLPSVSLQTEVQQDSREHQIEIDIFGNAMVVWSQCDSTTCSIAFNRFVRGIGWRENEASIVVPQTTGSGSAPQLATDSTGNTLVVWQQNDGTESRILSSYFSEQ